MSQNKKTLDYLYYGLLIVITTTAVMVNMLFGAILLVLLILILFVLDKYLSFISKAIVALLFVSLGVLVIHNSTTYASIYWDRDDFGEKPVVLDSVMLRIGKDQSIEIPKQDLGEVQKLVSTASSAWWKNKWEEIAGSKRTTLYEIYMDSSVARDYRLEVKGTRGNNDQLVVVYKESPEEYKSENHEYHRYGVYHMPQLIEYLEKTYNKSLKSG